MSYASAETGPVGRLTKDRDPTAAAVQAWLDLAGRDAGTCHDGGLAGAEQRELAETRRENRRFHEDVEILKRAVAIFATTRRECRPIHQGGQDWQAQHHPGVGAGGPAIRQAAAEQRSRDWCGDGLDKGDRPVLAGADRGRTTVTMEETMSRPVRALALAACRNPGGCSL